MKSLLQLRWVLKSYQYCYVLLVQIWQVDWSGLKFWWIYLLLDTFSRLFFDELQISCCFHLFLQVINMSKVLYSLGMGKKNAAETDLGKLIPKDALMLMDS